MSDALGVLQEAASSGKDLFKKEEASLSRSGPLLVAFTNLVIGCFFFKVLYIKLNLILSYMLGTTVN